MADRLATFNTRNQIEFKNLDDGTMEVTFVMDRLSFSKKAKIRAALESAGEMLTLSVSRYRKKRSKSANAYFWELVGKLAEKLDVTKEEIYWEYIKHSGVYRTVEVNEEAADTIIKIWKSHGLGWIAEMLDESKNKGYKLLNLYYGSSSYNSKQMSRLIDNVIKDCKDQGIETLPPEQIEEMKRAWESERVA